MKIHSLSNLKNYKMPVFALWLLIVLLAPFTRAGDDGVDDKGYFLMVGKGPTGNVVTPKVVASFLSRGKPGSQFIVGTDTGGVWILMQGAPTRMPLEMRELAKIPGFNVKWILLERVEGVASSSSMPTAVEVITLPKAVIVEKNLDAVVVKSHSSLVALLPAETIRPLRRAGIISDRIEEGEQAGADQPTTKPADEPPVKDQPSTPTSKDGPR